MIFIARKEKKSCFAWIKNLSPIEPLNGFSGAPKAQSTWEIYNINQLETNMIQFFKKDKTETVCVLSKIAIII